jgi:hypothetical protein
VGAGLDEQAATIGMTSATSNSQTALRPALISALIVALSRGSAEPRRLVGAERHWWLRDRGPLVIHTPAAPTTARAMKAIACLGRPFAR